MRSPWSILASLVVPMILAVGMFFVGRLFIRRPEVFLYGRQSEFGLVACRVIGYVLCACAVGLVLLAPIYFIALYHPL
jgi:hypothetical protein